MINLDKTLYGASLFALAFSLSAAEVSAQTCTAAPSCATLGFTKSSSDCTGHSVLKCPFDQSKLYCDSGAGGGNSGSETAKTYKVGDVLYMNNIPVGIVYAVDSSKQHGKVVTSGSVLMTQSKASEYCANKNTGSMSWSIPVHTDDEAELLCKVFENDARYWCGDGSCYCYALTDGSGVQAVYQDQYETFCVSTF